MWDFIKRVVEFLINEISENLTNKPIQSAFVVGGSICLAIAMKPQMPPKFLYDPVNAKRSSWIEAQLLYETENWNNRLIDDKEYYIRCEIILRYVEGFDLSIKMNHEIAEQFRKNYDEFVRTLADESLAPHWKTKPYYSPDLIFYWFRPSFFVDNAVYHMNNFCNRLIQFSNYLENNWREQPIATIRHIHKEKVLIKPSKLYDPLETLEKLSESVKLMRDKAYRYNEVKALLQKEFIEKLSYYEKAILESWSKDYAETARLKEEWRNCWNDLYLRKEQNEFENLMSPLEAFAVINNHCSFFFNNLNISIVLYFAIPIFFLLFFLENSFSFNYNNKLFFYTKKFSNVFFGLFKSLIISIRSERFFFFILSIFLIILTTNLAGFFLLELSITSHAIITLFISFIVFFNYFITSLIINNEKFINHFLLSKLNYFLMFVLFLIEFTSYFVRPFSLGIRLFANILSGHILIHIFFNAFIFAYSLFLWMSSVILLMLLFVLTMEIFVSFVQSYIFLILCIIYLQDLNTKH